MTPRTLPEVGLNGSRKRQPRSSSTGSPIIGPATPLDRYLAKVQASWLRTRMCAAGRLGSVKPVPGPAEEASIRRLSQGRVRASRLAPFPLVWQSQASVSSSSPLSCSGAGPSRNGPGLPSLPGTASSVVQPQRRSSPRSHPPSAPGWSRSIGRPLTSRRMRHLRGDPPRMIRAFISWRPPCSNTAGDGVAP
jgi:hypothetical protein